MLSRRTRPARVLVRQPSRPIARARSFSEVLPLALGRLGSVPRRPEEVTERSTVLETLASILPPGLLRFVGRLQFRVPFLRPIIEAAARRFASGVGVIRHGVGAGLKFDATGSAAGYKLGTSEIEEQQLLADLLNPGDTFYDIGANVGFYSTIAARLVGPTGHVLAFEPYGPSAELVARNSHLNGFNNVTVVQAAVSEQVGTARLHANTGSLSTHFRMAKEDSWETLEVPTTSIDSYVVQHCVPRPSVVMIDVEGAENEVLRGMLMTLRKYRPTIMCEVHWTGEAFKRFFDENLVELGYKASTYSGGPLPTQPCRYHALLLPHQLPRQA